MPTLLQKPGSCDTSQPFLKWLGGKRELVNSEIRPLYNAVRPIGRLVEPFCGSAAVALGLQVEHALLADINPHLIALFQDVQAGKFKLAEHKNTPEDFYLARSRFNQLVNNGLKLVAQKREAASIFYYLNRHCFNGLIRFNSKGEFNAAYGKYKKVWYENPSAYKDTFIGWNFSLSGYQQTLFQAKKDDFVYIDPPYDQTFTGYSKNGFTWEQQLSLAEQAATLPCPVVISNSGTRRITSLYKKLGFKLKAVEVRRSISCDGNRDKALEIIATKGF